MRSVVVVLPASMWAMMPMFLHRSNGTVLDTAFFLSSFRSCSLATEPVKSVTLILFFLPPIMREGLIGLSHAVNVFFFLDGRAFSVGGVQQFIAQFVDHAFFAASTGIGDQPANRQRGTPIRIHFYRHLIVRAAYAAGLNLEQRFGVFHGFCEQLQSFVAAAFCLQARQSFVEDAFRCALLALPHHRVDKLRHQVRTVYRIGFHGSLGCMSFSRHSVHAPKLVLLIV